MTTETTTLADLLALTAAHDALTLAYALNGNPRLSGEACRSAFNLARQIVRDAFMVNKARGRWAGESIVERAIETNEYEVTDLAGYLATFRADAVQS